MTTSTRRSRRRPVRSPQRQQGRRTSREKEGIDYTQDYHYVRHDLKRIAIWSILLFACMVAAYFVV
jgi:hypothetical protein